MRRRRSTRIHRKPTTAEREGQGRHQEADEAPCPAHRQAVAPHHPEPEEGLAAGAAEDGPASREVEAGLERHDDDAPLRVDGDVAERHALDHRDQRLEHEEGPDREQREHHRVGEQRRRSGSRSRRSDPGAGRRSVAPAGPRRRHRPATGSSDGATGSAGARSAAPSSRHPAVGLDRRVAVTVGRRGDLRPPPGSGGSASSGEDGTPVVRAGRSRLRRGGARPAARPCLRRSTRRTIRSMRSSASAALNRTVSVISTAMPVDWSRTSERMASGSSFRTSMHPGQRLLQQRLERLVDDAHHQRHQQLRLAGDVVHHQRQGLIEDRLERLAHDRLRRAG